MPTNTIKDPIDLDEKDKCTIPVFKSVVVWGRTQHIMMMGNRLNIMTQAPYTEDKANLPNAIYIMRTYTELQDGSRNAAVVIHNLTAWPIRLSYHNVPNLLGLEGSLAFTISA